MHRWIPLSACTLLLCTISVVGQQTTHTNSRVDRPFALVVDSKLVSLNGTYTGNRSNLESYAKTHPGSYLVFEERGSLYLENNADAVAEIERLDAPMHPLDAQQHALRDKMRPLEQQMKTLEQKMRAAQSPQEQTAIGAEMRQVGEQMERVGKEQGAVGEQQGKVGKAFYNRAQAIFVQCLANQSCRPA